MNFYLNKVQLNLPVGTHYSVSISRSHLRQGLHYYLEILGIGM